MKYHSLLGVVQRWFSCSTGQRRRADGAGAQDEQGSGWRGIAPASKAITNNGLRPVDEGEAFSVSP
jgi:hypothetical protein